MSNPAYVRSDQVNSVLYRGADFHIHEIALPLGGAAWLLSDLSALTGAPAAAEDPVGYVRSDHVNSVVYASNWNETDNHIHEIALPLGGAAWQGADLSLLTGATAVSKVGDAGGYVRSDQVNSVVYRGNDNHVHELALPLGAAAWQGADLSVLTGAPAAAGDPVGYVRSDIVNSVVYRGTDNHIHEIALPLGGAAWQGADLSVLTGAPAAAGDPVGYVRSDHVNSVVYRGTDNHIHEIALPLGGAAWQGADLSVLTGAPAAAGDPVGYVRSDHVNSVVYRGTDNHIHEIALPLGGAAWQGADLSARTGAPAAAGDPVGYVRSDQVNAVVYRGTDSHIHEIALPRGGAAWLPSDLSALSGAPPAI